MAIYVYMIVDGSLYSYCPKDTDPVADDSVLQAQGMAKKTGLHPLDETHAWDPPTLSVVTVTPLKSRPTEIVFWQRFTATEREAIEGLAQTGTQPQKNAVAAFHRYVAASGGIVDCNDSYVQLKVQQLEQVPSASPILAPGRAAQILV